LKARQKWALLLGVVFCVAMPASSLSVDADARASSTWAVYLYFGADNDLYQATEFCVDQTIKALKDAEADPSLLTVVALVDGPKSGDTKVFELTKDGRTDLTDEALGMPKAERTMTENATMVEFLSYAMSEFPASNSMLVLKNGHAWCGICPDDDNVGNEKLMMPIDGLRYAIETVYEDENLVDPWLDVLAFDGDNMGSIEVAYELRNVTDYFVGSQQQVPLEGLPYYLFMMDLADAPAMTPEQASIRMVEDFVLYYNNTEGKKQMYDKLISNSQMSVTAAAFRMGSEGEKMEAVVDAFDQMLDYMLHGELPEEIVEAAEALEIDVQAKLDQWYYPDADEGTWSWIPLNRNNISSSRDKALIGKMNDQQGYEWLPDAYTWLWSISALVNYDAYGDPVPPSEDVIVIPPVTELKDPFARLLLEDFMAKFGYEEKGIYRGVFDPSTISPDGALVWLSQCQLLNRSGNSFPHGLNIWFPPSWLQWDDLDEWSDMTRERSYLYYGCEVPDGSQTVGVILPAEYYCIDCPTAYDEIGLDFTSHESTSWMDFFEVYYDSRWLIYGNPDANKASPG
jgi:hypothetical protein